MVMKQKKPFAHPSVLQTCSLSLEEDMLVGASAEISILAAGQDYFEFNTDVEGLGGTGTNPFSVDDWAVFD